MSNVNIFLIYDATVSKQRTSYHNLPQWQELMNQLQIIHLHPNANDEVE